MIKLLYPGNQYMSFLSLNTTISQQADRWRSRVTLASIAVGRRVSKTREHQSIRDPLWVNGALRFLSSSYAVKQTPRGTQWDGGGGHRHRQRGRNSATEMFIRPVATIWGCVRAVWVRREEDVSLKNNPDTVFEMILIEIKIKSHLRFRSISCSFTHCESWGHV